MTEQQTDYLAELTPGTRAVALQSLVGEVTTGFGSLTLTELISRNDPSYVIRVLADLLGEEDSEGWSETIAALHKASGAAQRDQSNGALYGY
ncbi:MAG TPA: hypothetical protein V6D15_08480 [Oculatellaceae cyanobacterium]|jgi:hypothetical protein